MTWTAGTIWSNKRGVVSVIHAVLIYLIKKFKKLKHKPKQLINPRIFKAEGNKIIYCVRTYQLIKLN